MFLFFLPLFSSTLFKSGHRVAMRCALSLLISPVEVRLFCFFLFSWIRPAIATTDEGKKRSETSVSVVSSNVTLCKNEETSPTAALSVAYTFIHVPFFLNLFLKRDPNSKGIYYSLAKFSVDTAEGWPLKSLPKISQQLERS